MAENIQRTRGRGQGYKFDRGGTPAEFGPYIGVVKNNVDTLRAGRLQVYIEEFGDGNDDDQSLWRTVAYVPPFYGIVQQSGSDKGTGSYIGNPQSYGMWFTPPDIGTKVICFFAAGDPNQGYYTGCIPELGVNHMVPAIGASTNFQPDNSAQAPYFANATQLPVTEINTENQAIDENPKFYDQPKPVHSYLSAVMLQQGIINDTVRGPITSNSQRESPSAVYGISTPGRPVTQGNVNEDNYSEKVNSSNLKKEDIKIIGRRSGHSIVLDDGNAEGFDNLIRIRTGKGHQILMSDDGDCFHIIHANGQTWLEFGSEGTIDVFSTNSVNVRTQGEINLHADSRINMYAGEEINIKSKTVRVNAVKSLDINSDGTLAVAGKIGAGISSDGYLALSSAIGSWDATGVLGLNSFRIDLNSGISTPNLLKPTPLPDFTLPDVKFIPGRGWEQQPGKLKTITTRAPTHEPYPYHNRGVEVKVSLDEGASATGTSPVAAASSTLTDVPVTSPISPAQVIKQPPALSDIGNLSTENVTSLMASASAAVDQLPSLASVEKGIGKYGLSPEKLENLGIIKPGIIDRFGGDLSVLEDFIEDPTIWTGKFGITSIDNILDNEILQNTLQESVMNLSYSDLQGVGLVSGFETSEQLGGLVQSASQFSVGEVKDWATGIANYDIKAGIDNLTKNAYQAINVTNLTNIGLSVGASLVGSFFGSSSLPVNLFGSLGTVLREGLNNEVVNIIGNEKVLAPEFQPRERAPDGGAVSIDIRQIQRNARNQAIQSVLARGGSIQEAEAAGQRAGNLAGADALRNIRI